MSGAQSPRRWSSWRRLGALLGPGRGRATWAGSAAASSGVQPSQCRAQQAAARAVAARHSRACASVRGHLPWWALGRVACRLGSVRDGNSHDKLAQQDGSVDQLAAPAARETASRTFGKQAVLPALCVLAQEPAIAKVVVALDQLNAVPAPQAKLVGAAGEELICGSVSAVHLPGSTALVHGARRPQRFLAREKERGRLTHDNKHVARPAVLRVRAHASGHGHGCVRRGLKEGRARRGQAGRWAAASGQESRSRGSVTQHSTVHDVVI